ncbi:Tc toxin subunit A [Pseudomonas putida]|uniref:Tc toxin subunit A n=1 Tax=Pseudomonas putida TaxID=303 RepID=UPI0023673FF6|nr:Tc toxin subunit A [Pseudomonas putida]MDD2047769.1 Tc toxin subunit A [Pseudomonas putida]
MEESEQSIDQPWLQQWSSSQSVALQAVVAQAGSLTALVNAAPEALLRKHSQLHITDARTLSGLAQSVGIVVARQFRENALSGGIRRAFSQRHGVSALVGGPTYNNCFLIDWDAMALPKAIEASTSPVAYARALYCKALKLEQAVDAADFKLRLSERRSDLSSKVLDTAAMNGIVSTLDIVSDVLESTIKRFLRSHDEEEDVDKALAKSRYPFLLPYERWQDQINGVLTSGLPELTLGEVGRHVDGEYPYFIRKGAHSLLSDAAMQQSTGLGAHRRAMLIEAPVFTGNDGSGRRSDPRTHQLYADNLATEQDEFFIKNFGVNGLSELQRADSFCLATEVHRSDLDSLFALETQAPFISPNVPILGDSADPSRFGAVFINAGVQPPIAISTSEDEEVPVPPHQLINLTEDRADRLNRMIRLSRWMNLSFDQADRLVMAAISAEARGVGAPRMTVNTLRALGVFQDFHQRYAVTAEDFAAWLGQVSAYGAGEKPAQFDRIFNLHSLFPTPLVLDGSAFDIQPEDERGQQTVQQICVALGLSQETFQYLGRIIATAMEKKVLERTLPVLSSFYRITSLASCLKLHPIVLMALIEVLDEGGESLVRQIAGIPLNVTFQVFGYTDVLGTLVAVNSCVQWCRDNEIDVVWLIQHLRVPQAVSTDAESRLLRELNSRLEPVRITRTTLLEAGVPSTIEVPSAEGNGVRELMTPHWLCRLRDLVDLDGIVKDGVAVAEEDYADSARSIIEALLNSLFNGQEDPECEEPREDQQTHKRVRSNSIVPVVQEKQQILETLLAIVLRARAAQRAVVQESLADYLPMPAELVLPLVFWSRYSVFNLLATARALSLSGDLSTLSRPGLLRMAVHSDDGEHADTYKRLLAELAQLSRLARIAEQFQLDAGMLQNHARSWGEGWFGFPAGDVSLPTLYYLSLYQRLTGMAQQPAEKLLHYLWLVNDPELFATDVPPSEDQLRLVRDAAAVKVAQFMGWGASEVLEVAMTVNSYGIVFSLVEFDKLLRCHTLCQKTGLSARSVLELGALKLQSTDEQYRAAAQNALSCLTAQSLATERGPVAEVGQSVTTACTVSAVRLVAGDVAHDNVATVTLTIKDLRGKALQGISVRWEVSDAGSLHQRQTFTNEDGVTTVVLNPGVIMGIARVLARIGLDQDVYAPPVFIDCHEPSLRVEKLSGDDDLPKRNPLAGEKQQVELYVQLLDYLENQGIDRLVHWETDLGRLLSADVHTDRQGIARVRLVSRYAGVCNVKAEFNGRTVRLPAITFVDRPSIDRDHKLRLESSNVAGEAVTVCCRLIGLWGDPSVGSEIKWVIEGAGLDPEALLSQTDDQGIAKITFTPAQAGHVSIRAIYAQGSGAQEEPDLLEHVFEILSGPTMVPASRPCVTAVAAPGNVLPVGVRVDSEQDHEPPSEGKKPVARYPVLWSRTDQPEPPEQAQLSDVTGVSAWLFPLDKAGEFTLTARLGEQQLSFQIQIIPAPQWTIQLDDNPVTPSEDLTFRQGSSYRLHVQPAPGQDLLPGQQVLLTWQGPNVIGLGIRSKPMFGQVERMSEEGLTWEIDCNGHDPAQFALGIRLDELEHVTWLKVNLLGAGRQARLNNFAGRT